MTDIIIHYNYRLLDTRLLPYANICTPTSYGIYGFEFCFQKLGFQVYSSKNEHFIAQYISKCVSIECLYILLYFWILCAICPFTPQIPELKERDTMICNILQIDNYKVSGSLIYHLLPPYYWLEERNDNTFIFEYSPSSL